jgi:ABC-type antimicrobial peptide transport system permease subunit
VEVVAALSVMVAGLLAAALPSMRASKTDPMEALKAN